MKLWLAHFLCVYAFAFQALAAEPVARVDKPQTTVEVFVDTASVAPGAPLQVAVRFTPSPGWHTYWENYGDSGKPPRFVWQLPEGWSVSEPRYPTPTRIPVGPLMNYGYDAPASLLFELTPPGPVGPSVPVRLESDWLICEEICIPESGVFEFDLPMGESAADPGLMEVFESARAALPQSLPWPAAMRASSAAFELSITMPAEEAAAVRDAYFFPHQDGLIAYPEEQAVEQTADGLRLTAARPSHAPALDRASGVLLVENAAGGREGFAIHSAVAEAPELAPAVPNAGSEFEIAAWQAVLFGLLGGIILNLMPCVFPVLSLKAFSLIRSHGAGEAAARRDGLAYTAGILTSFLIVAAVFLALREGGSQIGWGFQLQSPAIVAALALVLFLLGLSLAGMIEIGGRLSGLGQGLTEKSGLTGSFFTGVLATVVATPCTAPFMAPALGFAIFQPVPVAIAIFLSLGFGLALPYLIVSFVPGARRLLPKPGRWMEVFRRFLAFPIFFTVVWLIWVLAQQGGADAVALVLAAMVGAAFVVWLRREVRSRGRLGQSAVGMLAVLLVAALGYAGRDILAQNGGQPGPASQRVGLEEALGVEPWSAGRVAELTAQGRPVFVYFTAAWCITCKVTERVALADGEVVRFIRDRGIAVLKADWTNQDDAIAAELERFGRNGVPLYLFYSGQAARPEILPQLFTADTFIEILDAELGDGAVG